MSVKAHSIQIILFVALTTLASACGGGGGGSSDSGGATTSNIDAQGQEIVESLLENANSQADTLSTQVGGAVAGTTTRTDENGRIDITPVFSGGTGIDSLVGVKLYYDNHSSVGSGGGYTILQGTVIGDRTGSGGADVRSEGLTRTFVSLMTESGKWAFDGVLDVDVTGSGYAGSPPFLIGSITDTLAGGGDMTAANVENGDMYIFDDVRIQVNISSVGTASNIQCSQDPSSFILLHKQGDSSIMTCILNADCSGCL